MSVQECIKKYLELSQKAFQLKRSRRDLWARGKDFWKTDGKFRSKCLEDEFRAAAQTMTGNEVALLFEADSRCKV